MKSRFFRKIPQTNFVPNWQGWSRILLPDSLHIWYVGRSQPAGVPFATFQVIRPFITYEIAFFSDKKNSNFVTNWHGWSRILSPDSLHISYVGRSRPVDVPFASLQANRPFSTWEIAFLSRIFAKKWRLMKEVKRHRARLVLGWVTAWEKNFFQTFFNFFCSDSLHFRYVGRSRGVDVTSVNIKGNPPFASWQIAFFPEFCQIKFFTN